MATTLPTYSALNLAWLATHAPIATDVGGYPLFVGGFPFSIAVSGLVTVGNNLLEEVPSAAILAAINTSANGWVNAWRLNPNQTHPPLPTPVVDPATVILTASSALDGTLTDIRVSAAANVTLTLPLITGALRRLRIRIKQVGGTGAVTVVPFDGTNTVDGTLGRQYNPGGRDAFEFTVPPTGTDWSTH